MREEDRSRTNLENAVSDSRLPQLRFVDRAQMCWHVVDVERLVEDDHPARAVWELIGGLENSGRRCAVDLFAIS
jgi:hypothetical protein